MFHLNFRASKKAITTYKALISWRILLMIATNGDLLLIEDLNKRKTYFKKPK